MSSLKEKVKGIFYNPNAEEQNNQNINNDEQQQIVDVVLGDWEHFREPRESMHGRWEREQNMYNGDHWRGLRSERESELRPNIEENLFRSQIESIVGKLTGWSPTPSFEEQEDNDKGTAADLNDYMPNELKQIKFRQKFVRAIRRCVLHGPFIMEVLHDPDFEGGRGQYRYQGRNDIVPVDLYAFYPDPRITDFIDLQKMSAIILRPEPRTMEYFRKRFGERGALVQPDNTKGEHGDTSGQDSRAFNRDLGPHVTNHQYTGDQTANLLEYWYRGLPKIVSREDREAFKDAAEAALERGADPAEYMAKVRGDMEGIHCIYVSQNGVFLEHKAYVYDHGQYPFVARTLYPEEGNIWGAGFGRDLISPQVAHNRFLELAMETMSMQGNGAIMYEEGAINKPRTWQENRSMPGAMLPVAAGRMGNVKEMEGINVPSTVFNMIEQTEKAMQKIPGQYDSSNGAADSRITSGEQAKALIAAAGTRLNTTSDLLSESMEEIFRMYLENMVQFYTNERIARVNGRQVRISRDSIIRTVETEYVPEDGQPDVDPETGMPVEPQVMILNEEFIPEFDIKVNISVDKPQDREYWMQLAFNMLPLQDPITGLPLVDGTAVHYAVQNGRMESMDVITRRIEQAANQQQQMQQAMEQAQQLQAQNQQLQAQLQQLGGQVEQQAQEDRAFDQVERARKLDVEEVKAASQIMKDGYQAPPIEPRSQNFDVTQGGQGF